MATLLDDRFWSRFASEQFEQHAFALAQVSGVAIPTDAPTLFAATCATVRNCPLEHRDRLIQFYVDQVRVPIDGNVPVMEDGSLVGYDLRIRRQLGDHPYLLRIEKLHAFHPPVWEGGHQLLSHATPHIGIPPGTDIATFIGRYLRTPSGVHADNLSSLTFPVIGEKTMRLWSASYVREHPDLERATEYSSHLGSSRTISASPGGMIYWPSTDYHTGESPNLDLHASISVGLWVEKRPLGLVLELLKTAAEARTDIAGPVRSFPVAPEGMPREFGAILSVLRDIVGGPVLEETMQRRWLETLTDLNLKRWLTATSVSVALDDSVALYQRHPILIRELADQRVIGACRGSVFSIPSSLELAVVRRLSTDWESVSLLGTSGPERVRSFLDELVRLDVVRHRVM